MVTTVTVNRGRQRFVVRDSGGPKPLYVYRRVLNPGDLVDWAKSAGLRDVHDPGDLHLTVVYSKVPVDWFRLHGDAYDVSVVGGPRRLEQFKDVVVLRVADSALQSRWDYFRRQGCSSDFAEYAPHVTLAGSRGSADIDKLEAYSGPVLLGPEIFAPMR